MATTSLTRSEVQAELQITPMQVRRFIELDVLLVDADGRITRESLDAAKRTYMLPPKQPTKRAPFRVQRWCEPGWPLFSTSLLDR